MTYTPGRWPVTEPADLDAIEHQLADEQGEQYVKRASEKALHEMCLVSIQHDLEQQPTPGSVQAKARLWAAQILAMAEDVAAAKRRAA
ncbi:hypothetical protein ACN2WE_21325 [Streptomyces sp. cg28]|uniref:hypothetical protein n=1 Tax=Streptomyces sp. cg28 TaxID=3403457 RepID=UPI003B213316